MKKALLIAASAAALLSLASCQKKELDVPVENGTDVEYTNLSISLNGLDALITTKATSATSENDINSVQVFVFRKGGAQDGMLDAAVAFNGLTGVSGSYTLPSPVKCTVGDRETWVIVNAPADYTTSAGAISKLADLKAKTVTLEDNVKSGKQNLVMVGNVMKAGGQAITKLTAGNMEVSMDVNRLVASVNLVKVINKIQIPAFQDKVSITGAYLMNVPGKQRLDGTLKASSTSGTTLVPDDNWYAKNKKATTGPSVLLTQAAGSPVKVTYGDDGKALGYLFYSFPSDIGGLLPSTDREEGDGTKFRTSTYLIVEATVNSTACIYPVLLPQLEANKKYNVTLTINHIGGDPEKPWDKIKFADVNATITVTPWGEVDYSESI